jgi:hypothetical protein
VRNYGDEQLQDEQGLGQYDISPYGNQGQMVFTSAGKKKIEAKPKSPEKKDNQKQSDKNEQNTEVEGDAWFLPYLCPEKDIYPTSDCTDIKQTYDTSKEEAQKYKEQNKPKPSYEYALDKFWNVLPEDDRKAVTKDKGFNDFEFLNASGLFVKEKKFDGPVDVDMSGYNFWKGRPGEFDKSIMPFDKMYKITMENEKGSEKVKYSIKAMGSSIEKDLVPGVATITIDDGATFEKRPIKADEKDVQSVLENMRNVKLILRNEKFDVLELNETMWTAKCRDAKGKQCEIDLSNGTVKY